MFSIGRHDGRADGPAPLAHAAGQTENEREVGAGIVRLQVIAIGQHDIGEFRSFGHNQIETDEEFVLFEGFGDHILVGNAHQQIGAAIDQNFGPVGQFEIIP